MRETFSFIWFLHLEEKTDRGAGMTVRSEEAAQSCRYSVPDGIGVMPPRGNLMADKLKVDSLIRLLDEVGPPLEQFVKTLPTHGNFLKSFCPAPEPV
ncbi:hypothetical protein [Asticcacaulis sp. AC460]|uniref:hypothetical protein n=1 Tax=Asticcacaulis sp. AC460 TaxID=1282360 RepID=UPI0004CE6FC6|nr:hypothetical protein [Asticcacaulis sp. AC460]